MMSFPPDLVTPALVVDQARLERNLREMANSAAARGIRLRPHAKTHKTARIGRMQLDLGAVGLTVATIGEAEKFADAGVGDLFIAYPVWPSPQRLKRLQALAERVRLRVAADSPESAALLASLSRCARPPEMLVEIDSGHHRTGVPPDRAGDVALAAARGGLPVAGVFTFPGHSYAPGAPEKAAAQEAAALAAAAATLHAAGITAGITTGIAAGIAAAGAEPDGAKARGAEAGGADGAERSGGSTPTAQLSADPPPTELRPGVYAFYDAQQLELGVCGSDHIALTAAGTVVSRPAPGRFVLDCGSKVLGADRQQWSTGFGRLRDWDDARIVALSEHHATVALPPGPDPPELGQNVAVIPNHVCAAVNLASELVIMRDGQVIDTWPVMARGANS
jgi:D-serine deaminase-like pyridoxal phosphate-dependent protein